LSHEAKPDTPSLKILIAILTLPFLAMSLNHDGFLSLLPLVREEFALTRTQVGTYSTAFFLGAAGLAIFTGALVDRLGSKRGILIGLAAMSIAVYSYGITTSFNRLLVMAALGGVGFGLITPSINKSVLTLVPPRQRALSLGIMHSGVGVGGFVGASLLPIIGAQIGWRITVQGTAVVALAVAFLILLTFDDRSKVSPPSQKLGFSDLLTEVKGLLRDFRLLCVYLLASLFAIVAIATVAHYVIFLTGDLGLDPRAAGLGLGILHIGGLVGRPVWGWLSDSVFGGERTGAMLLVGFVMGGLHLLTAAAIYATQPSLVVLYGLSLLVGLSVLGWFSVVFVAVGEMAGRERAGVATGLALLFTRVGMLIGPPAFGYLADASGDYRLSWLIFGSLSILGALLFSLHRARRAPAAGEAREIS